MKNVFTSLFLTIFTAYAVTAQDATDTKEIRTAQTETGELIVELDGLKSDKGRLAVALYDSSENWLSNNIKGQMVDIVDGKATVIFKDVSYGTYGISSFHDKNNNEKLDTGIFGIPKEPYASSRGAKGRFGPPKWENAKFEINASQTTEHIKY